MVVVVLDAEALENERADHRPRPYPGSEPTGLWPGLDEGNQFGALLLAQAGCPPGCLAGPKTVSTQSVVPAHPGVDSRSGNAELLADDDDALAVDVAPDRGRAPPHVQVAGGLSFPNQVIKRQDLLCGTPGWGDTLARTRFAQRGPPSNREIPLS